jgi:hypothetical protein
MLVSGLFTILNAIAYHDFTRAFFVILPRQLCEVEGKWAGGSLCLSGSTYNLPQSVGDAWDG